MADFYDFLAKIKKQISKYTFALFYTSHALWQIWNSWPSNGKLLLECSVKPRASRSKQRLCQSNRIFVSKVSLLDWEKKHTFSLQFVRVFQIP